MCNSWVYSEECILLSLEIPTLTRARVRYSCWVSDTTFFPSLCLAAWFDFFWFTGRPITLMQKHHSPNLWYGKLKVSSFWSSYMANRNVFWDLICLPVGQEDFSMGILAVILCMLNFLPGWNWSLILPVFLCVPTHTKSSKLSNDLQMSHNRVHLYCCMNISHLEAYDPAVISQENLILKFYIRVGGQK